MIRRWWGRRRPGPSGLPRQRSTAAGSRGPSTTDSAADEGRPGPLDLLLADCVARHFAGASVEGAVVRTGFANLEIECRAGEPHHDGKTWSAPLYLYLSGGRLGARPLFASISGYHAEAAEAAVVEGSCMWSCSFGPVLVSALTGADDPEVHHDDVVVGGRRWRLAHNAFDRWMRSGDLDGQAFVGDLRTRLGGRPHLTPLVLEAVPSELLANRDAHLLSVFVMEGFGDRTVEIKVNGVDTRLPWPAQAPEPWAGRELGLLRELAVLVPLDPPTRSVPLPQTLDRQGLTAVLDHLATLDAPGRVAGWRGWRTHGGVLGPVVPEGKMASFESVVGPLPEDYRRFLVEVAGSGAGPGYGLLSPRRIGDVVPLAQAGCNAVWLLRIDGEDRGSVWVDSMPLDGRWHRVADSFTTWYRDWLDQALQGRGAWTHWDPDRCTANDTMLAAGVENLETLPRTAAGMPDLAGKVTGLSVMGWNEYLPPPDGTFRLDHCQACAENLARHNLPEDVVERGALSRGR